MKIIQTVCGDISPEKLGFCQCHEHVYIHSGQSEKCHSALCIDQTEKTLAELNEYFKNGGASLVDAQPVGCGRDANALRQLSEKSKVQIIASTGFHKLCFYQDGHWIFEKTTSELAELYVSELQNGMSPLSDITLPISNSSLPKAGQIKTALDNCDIDERYEKLFEAASIAQKETDCPIMVHVEQGSNPLKLLEFFIKRNVSPQKLIFCHLDRAVSDISVHKEICRQGCFVECDTVGRFKYHSDEREIEIVKELLDSGFENKVLMSLDVTAQRLLSYGGEIGLSYIRKTFIPMLEENNINVEQIFVLNPKRAFAMQKI